MIGLVTLCLRMCGSSSDCDSWTLPPAPVGIDLVRFVMINLYISHTIVSLLDVEVA